MKRRPSATGALLEDYDMEDMIGRGRTGAVYRVRHKITGTTRVLRTIPSNKYKDDTGLQQQISVMKAADHPNLAKLYGTYSEGGKVHIILQFCAGGSVMDRIRKDGQFGEATAAKYFKQMLRAAQYMHNQDVVHRDLKLENFLFLSKEAGLQRARPCLFVGIDPLSHGVGRPGHLGQGMLSHSDWRK